MPYPSLSGRNIRQASGILRIESSKKEPVFDLYSSRYKRIFIENLLSIQWHKRAFIKLSYNKHKEKSIIRPESKIDCSIVF